MAVPAAGGNEAVRCRIKNEGVDTVQDKINILRPGKAASILLLAAAAVVSVLFPAEALFRENGFLAVYITFSEFHRMLAEIAVLFFLMSGAVFLPKTGHVRLTLSVFLILFFCWIHEVFLPMTVSAIYLACLLRIGCALKELVFRIGKTHDNMPDSDGKLQENKWYCRIQNGSERAAALSISLLMGFSAAILFFCLLSALGQGKIVWMRIAVYGCGSLLILADVVRARRKKAQRNGADRGKYGFWEAACKKMEEASPAWRAAAVWILVLILIQAGRMNLSLDFDTLWYGVRSEYILAFGGGIYDNPGLVGMAYVYSKGWEVLTLPLCDLASHSYLLFFNLWLAVLGLAATAWLAGYFVGRRGAVLAVIMTAALPGIMNMAVSAKTDIITWLLQLIMMGLFFQYLRQKRPFLLLGAAGAYFLSLTMKPTALVFSTAVFGMMGIYLLMSRELKLKGAGGTWLFAFLPAGALAGIWARTMIITGMPVTSVFTSVFSALGFEMKYPFAVGELPQNYQDESGLSVLLRRMYQMLLAPEGEDMSHVILAWGTSLLFFLIICVLVCLLNGGFSGRVHRVSACTAAGNGGQPDERKIYLASHMIFWPFLAVNLVSLVMLYQVDGNYFMLLYTMLLLAACRAAERLCLLGYRKAFLFCLTPVLVFNLLITSLTNWAWSAGFSEPKLINTGRMNHRQKEHERMISEGNAMIWQILEEDRENRVIAFGDHPFCLQFPCIVESYKDVTSPWGNVELVNSPEAFEEYMEYAGTDYIYAEAGYIGPGNWEWSYGLLRELIGRGSLTDLLFEEGNFLAAVSEKPVDQEMARENLKNFERFYRIFGQ